MVVKLMVVDRMTTIPTKVGMTLLTIYWMVMGGMVINLYYQKWSVSLNEYPN